MVIGRIKVLLGVSADQESTGAKVGGGLRTSQGRLSSRLRGKLAGQF